MPVISGGGGGGPAAGTYLPVADGTGVTVDTTTYANPIRGSGTLTTLVFPINTALLAFAVTGDAHPRAILASDPTDGWYFGNGTQDPYNAGAQLKTSVVGSVVSQAMLGSTAATLSAGGNGQANVSGNVTDAPLRITNGINLHSGAGVPTEAGTAGDLYIRTDPASDATYFYRCTVSGGAGAATWAPITGA